MIKTKAQAKKVAKEWQEIFVDFYEWKDLETSVIERSVEIKDKSDKGIFIYADIVAEFCIGRRLHWYIDTDDEGYIIARIY